MNGWWLKIQRAEKHMVDINQEAMRYAESHPYTLQRIRFLDSDDTIWGRFRITKQPDPMIAIMLGDFIHDLRSALDWVVVACSPRKHRYKAGFPILSKDIFAKNTDGNFMFGETERKSVEACLGGLCPEARAYVMRLQPYHLGTSTHRAILGLISRLENADKHREFITIGCGGQDFTGSISYLDFPKRFEVAGVLTTEETAIRDNTAVSYVLDAKVLPLVHPSEMNMHLTGTVKVFVEVARPDGSQPPDIYLIDTLMDSALSSVKRIVKRLESFVRSD
jgi:hypothetical protein